MRTTAAVVLACFLAAASVADAGESLIAPSATNLKARGGLADGWPYAPDRARRADGGRPPRGRVCFNQTEARDAIAVRRLADPMRALRLGRLQGDALSARLCRWMPDQFVYEINVLRHDGRILRMFMNAQSGETVSGPAPTGQGLSGQGLNGQGAAGQASSGQAAGHPSDKDR